MTTPEKNNQELVDRLLRVEDPIRPQKANGGEVMAMLISRESEIFTEQENKVNPPPDPNITTELTVIGLAMLYPEQFEDMRVIHPVWFAEPAHQRVWEAISQLDHISPPAVVQSLHDRNQGDLAAIVHNGTNAASGVPSGQIGYFTGKVQEAHYRREVHRLGVKLSEMASSTSDDLSEAVATVEAYLDRIKACHADEKTGLQSALDMLENEPPTPDQIVHDFWDACDKLAIIAAPKMRKSFFLLQLLIALATGASFTGLKATKARKVLLVNLEIRAVHLWRRLRRMARRLGADMGLLGANLTIINVRDRKGAKIDMDEVRRIAIKIGAEVIVFDPLYKLHQGDENTAKDMKPIMAEFDVLAEATGAGIAYVHHDGKGVAGDRNIRDRGAGSNTMSRDYDASIVLSQHRTEEGALVVEYMTRNYAPRDAGVIRWDDGCFVSADDLSAVKETANATRSTEGQKEASEYVNQAMTLVSAKPIPSGMFHDGLRSKLALSEEKARALTQHLLHEGKLKKSSRLGMGGNVLIGTPDQIDRAVWEFKNPGLSYSMPEGRS